MALEPGRCATTEHRYRPLLAVHLVAHPKCEYGKLMGQALFAALFEDPTDLTAHGMRIPVRFWHGGAAPPPLPDLDIAERSVVVALVDGEILLSEPWRRYVRELAARCDGPHVFLPVELNSKALDLRVGPQHWIRAGNVPDDKRVPSILNRVVHALYRELASEALSVFVSHAKRDGEPLAQEARAFLRTSSGGVRDWFDAHDLPHGSRWEEKIVGAARSNLLLAVRSDAYATREWCRIEVLEAKLAGSPVVVLDALETEEGRSFPYLGNGPVVRVRPGTGTGWDRVLTVILLEALRFAYFPLRVRQLCQLHARPEPDTTTARPPELLTLLEVRAATDAASRVLVYPDPPLGHEERNLVRRMVPELVTMTPTQLLAGTV